MGSIWLICFRWDILPLCIRHHISARCAADTLKRGCILISSLYKSAQLTKASRNFESQRTAQHPQQVRKNATTAATASTMAGYTA